MKKNVKKISLPLMGALFCFVGIGIAFILFSTKTQANNELNNSAESLPKLQGEKAAEYLKDKGLYDSLLKSADQNDELSGNSPLPNNSVYLQSKKLSASDGTQEHWLGQSVAISGNRAVVGAPQYDLLGQGTGDNRGAVYVFVLSNNDWIQQQQIIASDGRAGDRFGEDVDIDGDTIIVGARLHAHNTAETQSGAAYVYLWNGSSWGSETELINSIDYSGVVIGQDTYNDSRTADVFGTSVAIDENTVIIGAPDDTVTAMDARNGIKKGSVRVFTRIGESWQAAGKITDTADATILNKFGVDIDISGDTIIVNVTGRSKVKLCGIPINTEFITECNQFTFNSPIGQSFGQKVAIDENTIVIIGGGSTENEVYVSERSGGNWSSLVGIFNNISGTTTANSIAVKGNTIVVGEIKPTAKGNAYIFRKIGQNWVNKAKVTQRDALTGGSTANDLFGTSVGVDGSLIVVGAIYDSPPNQGRRGAGFIFQNVAPRPFDFDGNGASDISVYRPSAGDWYWLNLTNNQFTGINFGNSTDKIVPADYDGDGKTDYAVFRPSEANWYIFRSSDSQLAVVNFGASTDLPIPNDFDGDGKSDIAVWRPSNGEWYILKSSDGGFVAGQLGQSGDIPLITDFDADCKGELAVFRPSNGTWYWKLLSNGQQSSVSWGANGDIPVTADYDRDGKTDIAVWRPSDQVWYIINSTNSSYTILQFGSTGDIPVAGDYDADGKTDIAVWRPSDRVWSIIKSGFPFPTYEIRQFGLSSDKPVPAAYLP